MRKEFDIQSYMTEGVKRVVTDALRATAKNPKEAAFMGSFAVASKIASKKRMAAEKRGEHIPPFLIASITSTCNLHCAGVIQGRIMPAMTAIRQTSLLRNNGTVYLKNPMNLGLVLFFLLAESH